ncbi:ComEC/Rec2 family competence protein [Limnoglobus roseus]|uniref:Metallo-beta-lactamase domain-containing protein n=1 Tax=Limnoglobus roseus TaxID=2598579 RepID=A0A5C1A9N3_9BACT|nr:ComEC/Rec2 family competence protein [Limnoglobus roseus]QEL13758.1 hypothetical protein PX52LOC_00616 [Limnoglobus roseus]
MTPVPPPPWHEFVRGPLVPVALAASFGLIADRYAGISLPTELVVAVAGLVGWFVGRNRNAEFATLCLWGGIAGLAAAHHHTYRHGFPPDDIGRVVESHPVLVRVRGLVDETPVVHHSTPGHGFGPTRRMDRAVTILAVTEVRDESDVWQPASGRLRLSVEQIVGHADRGAFEAIRVGDEVEVTGQLSRPSPPGNPGEWAYAEHLLDERIRGELRVAKAEDAVTRLDEGGRRFAVLTRLQSFFTNRIDDSFPPREAALARALLLGDGSAMDRTEWDAFARTGVIHVLAISGQHLVILAGFVWWSLRIYGVRRRRGTLLVMGLVVGYAVLTGLRPSATRAAVMVVAACGGLLLRRPVLTANTFALAWLVVLMWNPTDPFTSGCQLSFVSVFVLIWGATRWFAPKPLTPPELILAETRSVPEKVLRGLARILYVAFGITVVLTLTNAPLVMLRQNVVPPVGVLVGPPLVLLTAVALLAGFLLLIVGPIPPLASVTGWCLSLCDELVKFADELPGGSVYVPTPALGWVVGFYGLLAAFVLLADRRIAFALLAWSVLGLIGLPRTNGDEFRVTFLAVGHGGCTVMETPDGRVLLYDVGTMAGPDAVRRIVAPYLWHRGISRVDEVFLSHADLDHFNGLGELLRRFPVGQVTMTPSFALKPTHEVADVLDAVQRRHVPTRVASAGDRFTAGDVAFEVLHPPREGPDGTENERSLVLRVTYHRHSMLLTGDLEKSGAQRLLGLPPAACDVLMAPHHGSRSALPPELVRWSSPGLVVASRGYRADPAIRPADAAGVPVWDTFTAGAITFRSNPTGLTAEAFRTGERIVVRHGR